MAQQIINIGTSPNKGDGEPLRTAFDKINDNFTEVYGDIQALRSGAIVADVQGTIVGDDSTILVDGVNSSINLSGTVKGDIIPDNNVAYDIGSTTKRFKDLYLSGNTINLGGTAISVVNGELKLGGVKIPTQTDLNNSIADVTAGQFSFNITADDSTVRTVQSGSNISIKGGTNITTASDEEGNITITGPADVSDLTDTGNLLNGGGGSGDLVGPASATDNAITRFDSTTGKLVQNSSVTISDTGAIIAPAVGSVIPFYFANQSAFPSAATYHGAVAHSHADGKMYFAHGGVWNALANVTDIPADVGDLTDTGNLLGTATITATISSGALDIDFSKGVLTVAHTANITSITFSNYTTNVKNEVIVILTQDSTGGRTITGTGYDTAGGLGLDISTTADHVNIVTFLTTDGSTFYGFSNGKNFS